MELTPGQSLVWERLRERIRPILRTGMVGYRILVVLWKNTERTFLRLLLNALANLVFGCNGRRTLQFVNITVCNFTNDVGNAYREGMHRVKQLTTAPQLSSTPLLALAEEQHPRSRSSDSGCVMLGTLGRLRSSDLPRTCSVGAA
jgi:hypothetical protein